MDADFLMHYGIKGMKWGVRRYQLKGSSVRTPAGKKRYAHKNEPHAYTASFNGRKIKLHVDYDEFKGEKRTDVQKNVRKSLKGIDFSKSLSAMRKYIQENDSKALADFDANDSKIKNPFRYVMPKSILIPRKQDSKSQSFHVLCNYRFDPEHGIAITYENGKVKRVVQQDYVL